MRMAAGLPASALAEVGSNPARAAISRVGTKRASGCANWTAFASSHIRSTTSRLGSLGWLVISGAARDHELPVRVVDDHETPCGNSKLLSQPRLNDDLQELAVDFADSLGEWRECRPRDSLGAFKMTFCDLERSSSRQRTRGA